MSGSGLHLSGVSEEVGRAAFYDAVGWEAREFGVSDLKFWLGNGDSWPTFGF